MIARRMPLRSLHVSIALLLILFIASASVVMAQSVKTDVQPEQNAAVSGDKRKKTATPQPSPTSGSGGKVPKPTPIDQGTPPAPTPTAQPTLPPTPAPTPAPGGARAEADPVVVSGSDAFRLIGVKVDQIAAYRYDNGWQPIVVQIDERVERDLKTARGEGGRSGYTHLFYADARTFVGADSDPRFDANDEIVFMSDAGGDRIPNGVSWPNGVEVGTRVTVHLTDPLQPQAHRYVYLFAHPNPAGAAGSWINYDFQPFGRLGATRENSTVRTASYEAHFSDEWINDAQYLNGVDILDQHKTRFALGYCARTEATFSEDAVFLANKVGPVRAVRSVMGANSGKYTQRDTFFYARRQVIVTTLRVHDVVSLMDYYDYTPAMSGMRYHSNLLPSGVIINGQNDSVPQGMLTWELLNGHIGSLVQIHQTEGNAFANNSSIYVDDRTPSFKTCTGDSSAYGLSGPHMHPVACTDPVRCGGATKTLRYTRTTFYNNDERTIAAAQALQQQVYAPITVTVEQ